jgi:hypothetical protein
MIKDVTTLDNKRGEVDIDLIPKHTQLPYQDISQFLSELWFYFLVLFFYFTVCINVSVT